VKLIFFLDLAGKDVRREVALYKPIIIKVSNWTWILADQTIKSIQRGDYAKNLFIGVLFWNSNLTLYRPPLPGQAGKNYSLNQKHG